MFVMRPLGLLIAIVVALAPIARAEEAVTLPPAPVAPANPSYTGGTENRHDQFLQWRDAHAKWRQAMKAWQASLTPAQTAELERREAQKKQAREAAHKAMQEEFQRRRRLPIPADGYTWQQAATARHFDSGTIAALRRDGIAFGPSLKQSFSPYLGGPFFITSDSLLNAYHVLFEDSFRQYELRQCVDLRKNLAFVLQQARQHLGESKFPVQDTAPAWRQVQYVVGPALRLLGSASDLFDPEVRPEIDRQVEKIRAARDQELPSWLAPAEAQFPALDYRACKPIGFYARDEKLSDYFRAVRWLQSVPFRANRPVEVAAIGMLGDGLGMVRNFDAERYFRVYAVLLGATDTRGLPEAAFDFQNFFDTRDGATWSQAIRAKEQWLLRDTIPEDQWSELDWDELLADASQKLSRIVYHVLPAYRTRDTELFQNLADRGAEPEGLAIAAMLGSGFARAHLQHLTPPQVDAASKQIAAPDENHRTSEQSLYEQYLETLQTLTAPPPPDAPAFMRTEAWQAKSTETILSGWAQLRHTFTLQAKRSELYFGVTIAPPGFVEPNPEFFSRMADLIERARSLLDVHRHRWDDLASISRQLDALAQKELRQRPWSPQDERFLKAYGERIAYVMGYDGNSYEVPNDDAPRWTEVHHDDIHNTWLAVAVGRPRLIYVLYPWNGMEILCEGSVLPYYEYASKERLTDDEWKRRLDSPDAPQLPVWLQPYLGVKSPPLAKNTE